ncbi:MAG TPA: TonB family protein [Opitutaceae bacterium]|nr:TonB family protein [Opitutaceae bacterium]HRJ47225.1 TonB family protein [Opitutaceae bacterium]
MTTVHGTGFDGNFLRPHHVVLEFSSDGQVTLQGMAQPAGHLLRDIRFSDRLGSLPRFIYLPGGITVESHDNDGIDAALIASRKRPSTSWIHWLEKHSAVALVSTLVLVAIVAAGFHFGLPLLARRTAAQVPVELEIKAGDAALASIGGLLGPSTLSRTERQRVTRQLLLLTHGDRLRLPMRLEFRAMSGGQANAFALPGGIIIVSDELVRLTDIDEEITAVLAHEIAHVELRHGLQSLLRSSFALLVVSTLTGDLSTLTTFAGTLPFLILQNGYSREFEREADVFAGVLLAEHGIPPRHLASVLRKLESTSPAHGHNISYLSTHPGTDERVRLIDPNGDHPVLPRQAPRRIVPPSAPLPVPAHTDTITSPLDVPTAIARERAAYSFPVLDTQPRPLHQVQPVYPENLRKLGISGEVLVDFVVDRGGDVRSPYAVEMLAHPQLQAAALHAVQQWKFTPGTHQGKPANARVRITMSFVIDETSPQ